jgi:uncharacterized membrane protein
MSQTSGQYKTKSTAWIWLATVGPILTIIGILIGSQKMGSLCGSVFSPQSHAAELFDTLYGSPGGGASSCRQSITSAAVPTWILIVLGIILVLTAIVVRSITSNRVGAPAPAAPAQSVATQIEDLSRLHQQGLINDHEFETKRAELMTRL